MRSIKLILFSYCLNFGRELRTRPVFDRCVYFCTLVGQGSSGSRVYSAMDITIGDLVVVCEWSLSPHQAGTRRTLSITDNQHQDMHGRLMKQVWVQAKRLFVRRRIWLKHIGSR